MKRDFLIACAIGNLQHVISLGMTGKKGLRIACLHQHYEIVDYLLYHMDMKNCQEAFTLACDLKDIKLISLFSKKGFLFKLTSNL